MATKRVRVCDVCESPTDLSRCSVSVDGNRRTLDLCREHVEPLRPLLEKGQRRRGEIRVVSMEEVEMQRQRRLP